MPPKARGTNIKLRRVYEPPARSDGTRILVERLWPRGIRKDSGAVDVWMKEVAPSNELRKWFGHDPNRWREFCRRYRAELKANAEAVDELRALLKKKANVTFVFAAKDEQHNSAALLKDYLTVRK